MAYLYPKISNCVIYKKKNDEIVEVTDYLTDEVCYLGITEAKYAKKLDGKTHPYDIETTLTEDEIDCLIEELDRNELLKYSNTVVTEDGTFMRTVWVPKWTINLRLFAFICNNLLIILWLPVLLIGILVFKNNILSIEFNMSWIGNIPGVVVGIIIHEFGHAFAGASYGARVFEMGVLILHYIMPGAYVALDQSSVKNRLKRIQINAAGIEMNLLLAGVFLIFGGIFTNFGGLFLIAAIDNILLAAMNLIFINGFDGMAILSELIGIEDIVDKAKKVVLSKKAKRELKARGASGNAAIAICYLVCGLQITLPLIFIITALEVLACFV